MGEKMNGTIFEHHSDLYEEFIKLAITDTCMKIPRCGDRVLVAAGLVGRGHP